MRLDQSSMDVATLADKIRRNEIDLQPDFQRGQVWSENKQKRLIDTILRGWYIPAIHIIVNDELDREEVLDGQQRLRAILDFMDDKFPIDGNLEPEDSHVRSLHGLRFSGLPDKVRSRFRRFAVTTVRLREYRPEEPGELFFRLNQLTALTAAEQRNALVGEPRNQIRHLSDQFESLLDGRGIGFSNARMNYDDTLSRLAVALESKSIGEKVTASSLEKRYRDGRGFPSDVIETISSSIVIITKIISDDRFMPRLNRASLFSWLFMMSDNPALLQDENFSYSRNLFVSFEGSRNPNSIIFFLVDDSTPQIYEAISRSRDTRHCVEIFNDRSSSRVNDVSSVLLRDLCLNVCLYKTAPESVKSARASKLRWSALASLSERLFEMPEDISERLALESLLAKQWDARRAAS